MEASACPKCGASVTAGEAFCAGCGYALQSKPGDLRKIAQKIEIKQAKQTFQGKIRSGRRTILACAVLFTLGTAVIWISFKAQLEKPEQDIAAAKGNPRFDQAKVLEAEHKLAQARGAVTVQTAGNALLALGFYGLWWWAKSRPLPATLSALILFIAIQMLNLALDPAMLVQGAIVKVFILVALVGAVNAAQKYQKMTQQGV